MHTLKLIRPQEKSTDGEDCLVLLDGKELKNVQRVIVDAEVGKLNIVKIYLLASVDIEVSSEPENTSIKKIPAIRKQSK